MNNLTFISILNYRFFRQSGNFMSREFVILSYNFFEFD